MNKEELTHKFKSLYDYMSVSNEPKYMMLFGDVMKDMMKWMIDNKPDLAEKMVDKLCSIKWKQYLTKEEAMEAVNNMQPPAPWDWSTWEKDMRDLGLECEREGVFNKYALWAVMNQEYTDYAEDVASILKMPVMNVPSETMVPIMHKMALSLLLDKDNRYCAREYLLDE